MFERTQPGSGGQRYSQLHATASALSATFNHANYSALLGFALARGGPTGTLVNLEMSSMKSNQNLKSSPHEAPGKPLFV